MEVAEVERVQVVLLLEPHGHEKVCLGVEAEAASHLGRILDAK